MNPMFFSRHVNTYKCLLCHILLPFAEHTHNYTVDAKMQRAEQEELILFGSQSNSVELSEETNE